MSKSPVAWFRSSFAPFLIVILLVFTLLMFAFFKAIDFLENLHVP